MNRAFYIVGIVFSLIFFFTCGFYVVAVEDARYVDFMSYSYSSYNSLSYDSSISASLTEEAAYISLFFFLCFAAIDILGLVNVKTKTIKVMGLISVSITGLFLLWDFAVISSPSSISYDEVGVAFLLYCLMMLAFCIVGLIQSINYVHKQKKEITNNAKGTGDTLDS